MLTASQQSSNFENPTPQWPVLSFIRMLWIRRFHILAVWIVLSAAAVTVVLKWPATYRAETLIVVDQQRIPEKFVSAAYDKIIEVGLSKDLFEVEGRRELLLSVALWRGGLPLDVLPAEGMLNIALGEENFGW